MNAPKLSLPIAHWSLADQAALRMAMAPGLRRNRAGRAARWRPATVRTVTECVGCFLAFLAASANTVAAAGLGEVCTEERVDQWIAAMRGRNLMANTIQTRVISLQRGCWAMYPFSEWNWLKDIARDLPDGKLETRRRKMLKLRHSRELMELGVRLIVESETSRFCSHHRRHVQARSGMMIAFLASRPLRLKNFTSLRLGVHLTRQEDGRWRLQIPPTETKNSETIDDRLPEDIGLLLDRYLRVDRRSLLARGPCGLNSDEGYLWISEAGQPMTASSIRVRIKEQTFKAFGVAITPHRFRDAGATTIAIELPAEIGMALPLLGNRAMNTIEAHYNMATTLEAAQRLNESLEAIMRELGLSSKQVK
jgi:site-specific recombinase XerD